MDLILLLLAPILPASAAALWAPIQMWGPFLGAALEPENAAVERASTLARPRIESITDVPDDQGRKLLVRWSKSRYDDLMEPDPVHFYHVFRRSADAANGWQPLHSIPATAAQEYSVVAPTAVDAGAAGSRCHSTYFIRAEVLSGTLSYDSAPDSACSIDNLAPKPPRELRLVDQTLIWHAALENDFDRFIVYGGSTDRLASAHRVGETVEPRFSTAGESYSYYLVTSVDASGNESLPAVFWNGTAPADRRAGSNP